MIDNEYNKIWIENGVMHAEYKPGVIIDMRVAKIMVENRRSLAGADSYPLCGDVRNLGKVSTEARRYLGSEEACEQITVLAIVIKNPFQKAILNFFQKFKKSGLKMMVFTDKHSALKWLDQQRYPN